MFRASRALMLQLDPRGFWTGSNSISTPPQRISDDALPVLAAFAQPTTFEAAFRVLEEEWEVDREDLWATVGKLVEHGFLEAAAAGAPDSGSASLARHGFGNVLPHFHMVRDRVRVGAYRRAIERHCAGKSVLEIGCGSGILSILAAKAGARRVVAIEESEIASLARRMFEANRCSDVVELHLGNSRNVEIAEPVDVIVHEILGADPLAENLIAYVDDARRRFLKPGGRLIPHRLEVACLGVEPKEAFTAGRGQALAEIRELASEYGMSFDPLLDDLAQVPLEHFPRVRAQRSGSESPRARAQRSGTEFDSEILTGETVLLDLDLARPPAEDLGGEISAILEVEKAGHLGALAVYFRAHLDEETVLSTSPTSPWTHWGWDVRSLARERAVLPGESLSVSVASRHYQGVQRVTVDLE